MAAPAPAQQSQVLEEGREEYEWQCLSCHGPEGKGDGEMAKILVVPPSDLTAIAGRDDGRFPFWRVYEIIEGKARVPGHETFQMPQFWSRFRADEAKPGYAPAHLRILLLTHYLDSIQDR